MSTSEHDPRFIYGGILATLAFTFLLWTSTRSRPHGHRLPGPRPSVLLGNLKDIPTDGNEWLVYKQMADDCGSDVVYLSALGSHVLVINSFEAARDLLEKKGAVYSSRPRFVMINEMMGWDWNLILMSYGKIFSAYRRVVQKEFQPAVVEELYRPVITQEVTTLLQRLFTTPENLVKHLKLMTGAIIMMVTYGHQVTSLDDEFVNLAERVREDSEKTPGSRIVDLLPFLKYTPSWFPGASFSRNALSSRQLSMKMRTAPYTMVMDRAAEGRTVPSLISRLLQSNLATEGIDKGEFIKNCSGVVYSAGADTTAAALINFVLAMTLYSSVQTRAQEELDEVIGRDRMPTFDDRERLPYIANVAKEALRWKAVSPLGVPHSTIEPDHYRGAYIPKDTTVLANIHAMLHDEKVYRNPDDFDPDRYLPTADRPDGEPDPARAAFGFGRRVCPGKYFAEDSVWLTIACILHTFQITKPAGSAGIENIQWSSGLVSLPSPFPFVMTPRFKGAPDLFMHSL